MNSRNECEKCGSPATQELILRATTLEEVGDYGDVYYNREWTYTCDKCSIELFKVFDAMYSMP